MNEVAGILALGAFVCGVALLGLGAFSILLSGNVQTAFFFVVLIVIGFFLVKNASRGPADEIEE